MTNNRNWIGWAALALAGMALFVALGGRNDRSRGYAERAPFVAVQAAPAQPPAPMAPEAPAARRQGPDFRSEMREMHGRGDMMMRSRGDMMMHGPGFQRDRGPAGPFWLKPFFFMFGLAQLLSTILLGWLLYRLFTQRRGNGPAGPMAPSQPENRPHDPRVE